MELELEQPENSHKTIKGRWKWKSNEDPWSKYEESKWEPYSPEENYLIEKAYYELREEVDFGDHVVSIRYMLQMKKDNITEKIHQRPVRRIDEMENIEEIDRDGFDFEVELPKTMNKVFGNLRDFMSFFSKRSPEMLEFTTRFNEFERQKDVDGLNSYIIPRLISCLQKELLEPLFEQLNDCSISSIKKKSLGRNKRCCEELISLFRRSFVNFEEFYEYILKAYSMSTSLFMKTNRYLRNESWTELDRVLPYVFCLCKTFFSSEKTQLFQDALLVDSPKSKSITLYRGTALSPGILRYYNPQIMKSFSWYSFTTTSLDRIQAERFMFLSADIINQIYPVRFIIEVPITEKTAKMEYLEWINIKQYSLWPSEKEVLLAPGSVFELQDVFTDKNKITTIRIKLKNELQSLAYKGFIMQGALQTKMMTYREIQIMCLEGEELFEALKCITGNALIKEVDFCLCKFDDRSLQEMIRVLSTMKMIQGLKFMFCTYQQGQMPFGFLNKAEFPKISRLKIYERNDFYNILRLTDHDFQYWNSLRQLDLSFSACSSLKDGGINNFGSRILKHLAHLESLDLNFSQYRQITGIELDSLVFEGLKYLPKIQHLSLNFSKCSRLTDRDLKNLCSQGFQYLPQLEFLNLNVSKCSKITSEGLNHLAYYGLKYRARLIELNLNFSGCKEIANEGIDSLASQGLKYLTQLTSLNLDLSRCVRITDESVKNLCSQGLKYLTQLTTLSLNFSECEEIGDEGIGNLASEGLNYLNRLKSLHLDFSRCIKITDEGIKRISSLGLRCLSQLTSLSLNFSECEEIADEGLDNLVFEGLQSLKQLVSFDFDFSRNLKITNKGAKSFSKGLKYLNLLKSLSLNFSECEEIADEAIGNLASEGLKDLNQLKSLKLDFSKCFQLTDKDLESFSSHGLQNLNELTSLTLNFSECEDISGKGITSLASQGLVHLHQLTDLNIDFSWCSKITDQNIEDLWSDGLIHLIQLNSLNLNLANCSKVTQKAKNFSLKRLDCLTQLKSLYLNFEDGPIIWNQVNSKDRSQDLMNSSCELFYERTLPDENQFAGHRDFSTLSLHKQHIYTFTDPVEFINQSKQIQLASLMNIVSSDEDKRLNFCNELLTADERVSLHFPPQASVSLNFSGCKEINDEIMENLILHGLKPLFQLTSLNLDFSKGLKISVKGMNQLWSQGLQYLFQLIDLSLDFSECEEITNKTMEDLASQGLKHLTHLTSLNLNFGKCFKISDRGLKDLCSNGVGHLIQLTSLNLNFTQCSQITDEGVANLWSDGFKHLRCLTSLHLNFSGCLKITDDGINILCDILECLKQLTSLHLNFSECLKITDDGIIILAVEGLKNLAFLTSLHLDFSGCFKLTDEGPNNLWSHGLESLNQLTSLSLNFSACWKLTDEVLNKLFSRGFSSLNQLVVVNLNFSECELITSFTKSYIPLVLDYLGFIPSKSAAFQQHKKRNLQES